jgi:hypothetical protein
MGFQIMQVTMPKKAVERTATGSQYDVVRELPIGGAFFVPCNEGEDLNKCMRRVCGSCVRIAQDADVRLAFRSLDAETAKATFGDAGTAAGVGVWRIEGAYNHRASKSAPVDTGVSNTTF